MPCLMNNFNSFMSSVLLSVIYGLAIHIKLTVLLTVRVIKGA